MDLTSYVDALREELLVAAEAGGDDSRDLTERLINPLASATRLALLDALVAAMDEVTRELAPGSVEVRLRGREPDFVVTAPPSGDWRADARPEPEADLIWPSPGPAPAVAPDDDEGGTARITLRLPAHLKPRIDEAAARAGISANAWLVRAVTAGLDPAGGARSPSTSGTPIGRRHTGWVR